MSHTEIDFTKIKNCESSLLQILTHNLPDMLWAKDIDCNYLYVNESICNGLLMAKDTNEPIGKNDVYFATREREKHKDNPDWHTFGELCFNSDLEVIKHKKPMKFEEYGNVKGKLLYLEVYKAPFFDEDNNIIGTVGTGRDITELKNIQFSLEKFNEQLENRVNEEIKIQQEQEKLIIHQSRQIAMGEMLEAIAHQWRQPLNITGLACSNIELECITKSQEDSYISKNAKLINENIKYMSDTIDDFRGFLDPNKATSLFSISDCIKKTLLVFDAQLKQNNIEIELIRNSKNDFIDAVENEIKQVFIILINNSNDAIKKVHTDGPKKENYSGKIDIVVSSDDKSVIVDVCDNGGGIKEENIERVFEAYFSTKSINGNGVGLYIAKNIIEKRSNGTIDVKNNDKGCCFTITFSKGSI